VLYLYFNFPRRRLDFPKTRMLLYYTPSTWLRLWSILSGRLCYYYYLYKSNEEEKKNWLCLVEITEHQMCNLGSAMTSTVFDSIIITIIINPLTIMLGLNPDYYVTCMYRTAPRLVVFRRSSIIECAYIYNITIM